MYELYNTQSVHRHVQVAKNVFCVARRGIELVSIHIDLVIRVNRKVTRSQWID